MNISGQPSFGNENREVSLFAADLRVDFVRHGKPFYSPEEKAGDGQVEGLLAPEGKVQAQEVAQRIAAEISNDELAVVWCSQRNRALETAAEIVSVLKSAGIEFVYPAKSDHIDLGANAEIRTITSLSSAAATWETMRELERIGVMDSLVEFWVKGDNLPKGLETIESVHYRSLRVLTYLIRVAKRINVPDKKLHFICVGHEEGTDEVLEHAFGMGVHLGDGPKYAELTRVDISSQADSDYYRLEVAFRDQKSTLQFDPGARKII
jgi:broad specificity phosphatase PhoE